MVFVKLDLTLVSKNLKKNVYVSKHVMVLKVVIEMFC